MFERDPLDCARIANQEFKAGLVGHEDMKAADVEALFNKASLRWPALSHVLPQHTHNTPRMRVGGYRPYWGHLVHRVSIGNNRCNVL